MHAAIQNTIAQYIATYIETVSTKFNIPQEDLNNVWKEVQKEKLKIKPRRRVNANKTPSAYINFCNHHRKIIKAETPGLTFGEVAKALGQLWKSKTAEEKQKYSDPAYVGASVPVPTPAAEEGKKVKRARKNKE